MPKPKKRIKSNAAVDFKIDPAVLKEASRRLEDMVRKIKQQKKVRTHS
jgi:hypothetical protein